MVQFSEAGNSPVEHYTWQGMNAERTLYCAWEDRQALVQLLLGKVSEFTTTGPAPYPGTDGVYALDMTVRPFVDVPTGGTFDAASSLAGYTGKKAQVDVKYETLVTNMIGGAPAPEIEENTVLTYTANVGGEFREMKGAGLQWASNATLAVPDDIHAQKKIVIIDHQFHWRRLSSIPWNTIRACAGCVNNALFCGAPVGTVLFNGASITAEYILKISGSTYEAQWYPGLRYSFREMMSVVGGAPMTWNTVFRSSGTPGWDMLKVRGSSEYMHPSASLGNLFYYGA